jgi:hypothetical protein
MKTKQQALKARLARYATRTYRSVARTEWMAGYATAKRSIIELAAVAAAQQVRYARDDGFGSARFQLEANVRAYTEGQHDASYQLGIRNADYTLTKACEAAYTFLSANYSDADMPDILPLLRKALRKPGVL